MQINIAARHGHLSEATQEKIRAKVEQRLPRLFERLQAIDVIVDLEHKDTPTVTLQVSAEHKHDFVAVESTADLITAVDGAVHKIEQQIRKYKQKVQDHHKTPGLRQQIAASETEADGE